MKSIKASFFLALILSITSTALPVVAQSKPNVSGTWKMNAEKSKFERGGPKAITIKFDQKESTLNETLTITNDGGEHSVTLTYTLDGKESAQQIEGQPLKATARWEGDSLTIEFKNDEGFSFRRKITLSADGKTMTLNVTQSNQGGTANDTVILEKQ
jgi:hypothetical protein